MSKPREWWIADVYENTIDVFDTKEMALEEAWANDETNVIHVIEHSVYVQCREELSILKQKYDQRTTDLVNREAKLHETYDKVEELQKECDKWKDEYQNLCKFANQFEQERDEARGKVERLSIDLVNTEAKLHLALEVLEFYANSGCVDCCLEYGGRLDDKLNRYDDGDLAKQMLIKLKSHMAGDKA